MYKRIVLLVKLNCNKNSTKKIRNNLQLNISGDEKAQFMINNPQAIISEETYGEAPFYTPWRGVRGVGGINVSCRPGLLFPA
jgi:hypothetical protein